MLLFSDSKVAQNALLAYNNWVNELKNSVKGIIYSVKLFCLDKPESVKLMFNGKKENHSLNEYVK
ncbi:hypothetical protein [Sphingobacterium hungaricum]|uniref:Uncharacterized protein n=1 Tax=Sphingobacterium hungaricum TaxID=2082723 RepID=A0A928V1N1_9SPHI|nr:hypothetical protein [Sphingobacterium hungaricum]MBE8714499.1 hypothetical protein [Sphingobacterium hungaricum]